MPRGSAFILRICFCLAEMADKIIYWVKIAGQELSALVFPRSFPLFPSAGVVLAFVFWLMLSAMEYLFGHRFRPFHNVGAMLMLS